MKNVKCCCKQCIIADDCYAQDLLQMNCKSQAVSKRDSRFYFSIELLLII